MKSLLKGLAKCFLKACKRQKQSETAVVVVAVMIQSSGSIQETNEGPRRAKKDPTSYLRALGALVLRPATLNMSSALKALPLKEP